MKQNRPMLFDFTGVNCVNCRLMEKKMAQPNIQKRLDKLVLVQLYADKVPNISDKQEVKRLLQRNTGLQSDWFGDVTLPAYAVVTPDGKTILSMYLGLERKDGEFAAFLDDGMKKWQDMHGNAPALQVVERP
jgi:thiol:disulfide interchange protein